MSDIENEHQKPKTLTPDHSHIVGKQALGGVDQAGNGAADNKKAPRTPSLQNGERTLPSGDRYITPDMTAIAAIVEETNGKVQYFPAQDVEDSRWGVQDGESGFAHYITGPLYKSIQDKYPGKTLALRGVMTSINGAVPKSAHEGDSSEVRDITETVSVGSEKEGEIFNVAVMDEERAALYRVTQYAYRTGFAKKMDFAKDVDVEAVFPAILVYDESALRPAGHRVWGVSFREEADPQAALLSAYILDCPKY